MLVVLTETYCNKTNRLFCVASRWTIINIFFCY